MEFTILGDIADVETFATGRRIRELKRLRKRYGRGRWRKRKGMARIRLADGSVRQAEFHWYEAAGIGKKETKIKRYQNGADRAQYGQDLLNRLSSRLEEEGSVKYHFRELRRCREFYVAYPRIRGTLSPGFDHLLPQDIRKSLPTDSSAQSALEIRGTPSPELQVPAGRLVKSLSFSHFAELIPIDEPLKRAFYEIECIRGHWSVRELKRQIGSLYYERSGLSRDKKTLAALAQAGAEQAEPQLAIRDPYVFEFLGIKSREVMSESDLEDALLDKLQDFLLELGHGFCFEARQKAHSDRRHPRLR